MFLFLEYENPEPQPSFSNATAHVNVISASIEFCTSIFLENDNVKFDPLNIFDDSWEVPKEDLESKLVGELDTTAPGDVISHTLSFERYSSGLIVMRDVF